MNNVVDNYKILKTILEDIGQNREELMKMEQEDIQLQKLNKIIGLDKSQSQLNSLNSIIQIQKQINDDDEIL